MNGRISTKTTTHQTAADWLITELTAHSTLALGDALANDPAVAFQAVLQNSVLSSLAFLMRARIQGEQSAQLIDHLKKRDMARRH